MSNPQTPPLQIRMMAELGLTASDFAHHASDLYVVAKPGVKAWLDVNLEYPRAVTGFRSPSGSGWNGAGQWCYEIPFLGFWPCLPKHDAGPLRPK